MRGRGETHDLAPKLHGQHFCTIQPSGRIEHAVYRKDVNESVVSPCQNELTVCDDKKVDTEDSESLTDLVVLHATSVSFHSVLHVPEEIPVFWNTLCITAA